MYDQVKHIFNCLTLLLSDYIIKNSHNKSPFSVFPIIQRFNINCGHGSNNMSFRLSCTGSARVTFHQSSVQGF